MPTCVVGSSGKCEADVAAIKSADVARSNGADVASRAADVAQCSLGPGGLVSCDFVGKR